MSAEEIIETLPICRRAVRLTQAELMALKRERLELEDNYLRLRTTFIHEIELMMKEEKDQERVMLRIRKKTTQAASRLLSSKRRNTAMQDILTELDARGEKLFKLQHEVSRLHAVLRHHKTRRGRIPRLRGRRSRSATSSSARRPKKRCGSLLPTEHPLSPLSIGCHCGHRRRRQARHG